MADLKITLGADTKEFERSIQQAGKTMNYEFNGRGGRGGKGGGGGFSGFSAKGYEFAENLMGGRVGTAIGSLFGPLGQAAGSFVDTLILKAKELMDKSIELRNLSYQTGLSSQQIQGLESVAKASGISIGKLADSISEFNRRVGYAQIHGGELNFLFNKLGVKMADVKNGTFNYFDAIEELRKAQEAGTDQAVLNHYAQVMLGSSYKELLPLIKTGSDNLKLYSNQIYKVSNESIEALQSAGDYWNIFTENVKNMAMDMLGWLLSKGNENEQEVYAATRIIGLLKGNLLNKPVSPEEALKQVSDEMGIMDPQTKKRRLQSAITRTGFEGSSAGEPLGAYMQQKLFEELDKKYPKGKNLNPYGLGPAQGASTMQQMGGGDLFGAVSFNPQQETANNTKITADQITQLNSKVQPSNTANPNRDDLNK